MPTATKFTCIKGCTGCCGIQPVTQSQLLKIQLAVGRMSRQEVSRLKRQNREPMSCPLVDVEKSRCSVYNQRPEVCRMFGYYDGLVCPHHVKYATGSKVDGFNRIQQSMNGEESIGLLGLDFTWENQFGQRSE